MVCEVLLGLLALANIAAFVLTRHDKKVAQREGRSNVPSRVPESRLWALAAFGGWPGGALAMLMYRHKTRKLRFLVPFVLAAAIGTVAWAGWLAILDCIPGLAR